jgi:hypothetical protein
MAELNKCRVGLTAGLATGGAANLKAGLEIFKAFGVGSPFLAGVAAGVVGVGSTVGMGLAGAVAGGCFDSRPAGGTGSGGTPSPGVKAVATALFAPVIVGGIIIPIVAPESKRMRVLSFVLSEGAGLAATLLGLFVLIQRRNSS